ncbi:hypothetical protein HDV06_004053 [Boothiomyces sp. JEL0866]|nr:hypothetical protein HDV06_004053 [Boothiomyces sp. JEL0866]
MENISQYCSVERPNISGTLLSTLLLKKDYIYDKDLSLLISENSALVPLADLQVEAILQRLSKYKSIWIPAFPDRYIQQVRNVGFKGDLYQLYLCDSVPTQTEPSWIDGEDKFTVKPLSLDIVEYVMTHATIDYPKEYIEMLAEKFSNLTAVVFCNDVPVSWCLTHSDFSIGLMGTVETHRGRGLAKKCVSVVLNRHYEYLKDKIDFFAYCYIKDENIPSAKAMTASGFVASGNYVRWLRLDFQ